MTARQFWLTLAAFVLLGTLPLSAGPVTDEDLLGYWSGASVFDEPVGGTLTIRRTGTTWSAQIGDLETDFTPKNGAVSFRFADRGGFRGRLTDQGMIDGFWIQPARPFPTLRFQPMAQPIFFKHTAPDIWRGRVAPLPDQFTIHLSIFGNEEGSLTAAFRNPERNAIGASQYGVMVDGTRITFSAPRRSGPPLTVNADLSGDGTRLAIDWPRAGEIILNKVTADDIPHAFPRPRAAPPYTYQAPEQIGDGWETAHADDVKINSDALTALVQNLATADPFARRPRLMHSLLVARHGQLVLEEYFFGHDREMRHDIRSAGKTFAAVLLGAVMAEGGMLDPDTKIYDLLDAEGTHANRDPRKQSITLAHLLTHTSGLDCNDSDGSSPGGEDRMQDQTDQPDWWRYTLDLPMKHDPGTRYAYCSGGINLIGGALTKATNTWLPQLFHERIATLLQFGSYTWNLTPTDDGYLGGGARLRPRDLLKVGQAYLDGGVWNDHRIATKDWVAEATRAHIAISPETVGIDLETFQNNYTPGEEGYAWHLYPVRMADRTVFAYEANGNGGQVMVVVPEYDLVVVLTGGNYGQGGIWSRWRDEIIGGAIIPAIAD